jgi:hypothetical protein
MIKIKDMMGRAYSTYRREEKNAYKIFVGKCEEDRPLGSPRHRWEDNIKKCLKKSI